MYNATLATSSGDVGYQAPAAARDDAPSYGMPLYYNRESLIGQSLGGNLRLNSTMELSTTYADVHTTALESDPIDISDMDREVTQPMTSTVKNTIDTFTLDAQDPTEEMRIINATELALDRSYNVGVSNDIHLNGGFHFFQDLVNVYEYVSTGMGILHSELFRNFGPKGIETPEPEGIHVTMDEGLFFDYSSPSGVQRELIGPVLEDVITRGEPIEGIRFSYPHWDKVIETVKPYMRVLFASSSDSHKKIQEVRQMLQTDENLNNMNTNDFDDVYNQVQEMYRYSLLTKTLADDWTNSFEPLPNNETFTGDPYVTHFNTQLYSLMGNYNRLRMIKLQVGRLLQNNVDWEDSYDLQNVVYGFVDQEKCQAGYQKIKDMYASYKSGGDQLLKKQWAVDFDRNLHALLRSEYLAELDFVPATLKPALDALEKISRTHNRVPYAKTMFDSDYLTKPNGCYPYSTLAERMKLTPERDPSLGFGDLTDYYLNYEMESE